MPGSTCASFGSTYSLADAEGQPPLVLLAGAGCDERVWGRQVQALAPRTSVLVFTPGSHRSVTAFADEVLDGIGGRAFSLAGFSLGGVAALEIMRRVPQQVLRLALLSTTARADPPAVRARRSRRGSEDVSIATQVDRGVAVARGSRTDTQTLDLVRSMIVASSAHRDAQAEAIINRPDYRDLLATISCPTLVLCGSEDRATPPALSREIATSIPGADLIELPAIGHMAMLEAAPAVNAALSAWLDIPARTSPSKT